MESSTLKKASETFLLLTAMAFVAPGGIAHAGESTGVTPSGDSGPPVERDGPRRLCRAGT